MCVTVAADASFPGLQNWILHSSLRLRQGCCSSSICWARVGDQLMRHVFRWRSRSTQIASGVEGLSMGTWTDCGYLRGSWAAVGLNPRRESPSGWGLFLETVCLVPAVALTGCVGSSGRSKLGLALTGVVPDVPRRLCLGNAWVSQPHVGAPAGHFG